jgi:hypothetical protein
MKQFISTKFFLLLQEASQNRTEVEAKVLELEYEVFAYFLFNEAVLSPDKVVFHDTLCYMYVEFANLQRQQSIEKNISIWLAHRPGRFLPRGGLSR